jgi:hypothetical protein
MRSTFGLVVLIAGLLLASAGTVEGCTCSGSDVAAPCELYRKAPVAFVGRVVGETTDGLLRFQVSRRLKGVPAGQVRVVAHDSVFGCGFRFGKGEEYVVFAERNKDGVIEVFECSDTVWSTTWNVSYAAVAFVESLRKPAAGGLVYGEVELLMAATNPWKKPVEGAAVILRGGGEERRTTTVKGRYEFAGLPAGVYTVSVSMPAGLPPALSTRVPENAGNQLGRPPYNPEPSRRVTITHNRSCGYAPFEADANAPPR